MIDLSEYVLFDNNVNGTHVIVPSLPTHIGEVAIGDVVVRCGILWKVKDIRWDEIWLRAMSVEDKLDRVHP